MRKRARMPINLSCSENPCTWGSSKALSCDSRECELPVVVETQKQKETEIKILPVSASSLAISLKTTITLIFDHVTGRKRAP